MHKPKRDVRLHRQVDCDPRPRVAPVTYGTSDFGLRPRLRYASASFFSPPWPAGDHSGLSVTPTASNVTPSARTSTRIG